MDFDLTLLIISFVAGLLTVFAPCTFAFLPVILGKSTLEKKVNIWKPITIVTALSLSIILTTVLLKATTLLIDIPQSFWNILAGLGVGVFGYFLILPEHWDWISYKLRFSTSANQKLNKAQTKTDGIWSDILIGFALGPVFSSCSPTYFIIIGTVFPSSFTFGIIYTLVYTLGLAILLLAIAVLGQKFVQRFNWAVDPHGKFKRILGIIFLLIGWSFLFGIDKQIQTYFVEETPYLDISTLENFLIDSYESP